MSRIGCMTTWRRFPPATVRRQGDGRSVQVHACVVPTGTGDPVVRAGRRAMHQEVRPGALGAGHRVAVDRARGRYGARFATGIAVLVPVRGEHATGEIAGRLGSSPPGVAAESGGAGY